MKRRLVVLVIVLAAAGIAAVSVRALTDSSQPSTDASASPTAGADKTPSGTLASGNNVVVLVNTHDGKIETKSADGVARETGDVVDNANAAYSYSRCTDCRTVAVAMQVVLVFTKASNVQPKNLAIAQNQSCTRCESMASAYQFVVSTGGVVHFTSAGQQRMQAVAARVKDLIDQPLDFPTLDARLDVQADELWSVVSEELRRAGKAALGTPRKAMDTDTDDGTPTISPSPTPTASVTGSPSESPEPSPAPTATDTASASVAATSTRRALGVAA